MSKYRRHIKHLYEDNNLTFKQLKSVLTKISMGFIDTYEKFDGANLLVSLDQEDNTPIVARSKKDMEYQGLKRPELLDKFSGRAELGHMFTSAYDSVCEFFSKVDGSVLNEIFEPSERNWVSCEVVSKDNPNIMRYDKSSVIFHNSGMTNSGQTKIYENKISNAFNMLNENQLSENLDFGVSGPKMLEINVPDKKLKSLLNEIEYIVIRGRVNENNTIGEFKEKWLHRKMLENITNIYSPSKLNEIKNYILKKEPVPRLTEVKKNLSKEQKEQVIKFINNSKDTLFEIVKPIEQVCFKFALEAFRDKQSSLVEDQRKKIVELKNIKDMIIRKSMSNNKIVEYCVNNIKNNDVINSTVEGAVFNVNNNIYKLVGFYQYLNKLNNLSGNRNG